MGVTVLPSEGARIGAMLAQLGEGLSQIINPRQQQQRALRQLITTNPQAITQMAAAYRQNPNALRGLVGNELTELVLSTPPSVAELLGDIDTKTLSQLASKPESLENFLAVRRAVLSGAGSVEGLATAGVREKAGAKVARERPEVFEEDVIRRATGLTAFQREFDALKQSLIPRAESYISSLPVGDAAKGAARSLLPGLVDDEDAQRQFDFQKKLIEARDENMWQRSKQSMDELAASRMFAKTNTGSPERWLSYIQLGMPVGVEEYADLQAAVEKLDTFEKARQVGVVSVTISRHDRAIQQAFRDEERDLINKEQRDATITRQLPFINQQLNILGSFVDLPKGLHAEFGKIERRFRRDIPVFHYVDAEGKEYSPVEVDALIQSSGPVVTAPGSTGLSPEAQSTLDQLNDPNIDRDTAIRFIQQNYPEIYAELRSKGHVQ